MFKLKVHNHFSMFKKLKGTINRSSSEIHQEIFGALSRTHNSKSWLGTKIKKKKKKLAKLGTKVGFLENK